MLLLLVNVKLPKEDYRDEPETMHQLIELVVTSLDVTSRNGVSLMSGGKLHLIPIGNTGDWPYLEFWCEFVSFSIPSPSNKPV